LVERGELVNTILWNGSFPIWWSAGIKDIKGQGKGVSGAVYKEKERVGITNTEGCIYSHVLGTSTTK
jgi:hypothetical protein